jgi:hypothetical protein
VELCTVVIFLKIASGTVVSAQKLITDTVVESISLEDRNGGVFQEVEFLTFRDSLLTKLKGDRVLCCPDKLAGPLVFTKRDHVS